MGKTLAELKKEWMKNPEFRAEYEALKPEFAIAREILAARKHAKLTQAQLAKRMGTTQSVIARYESGTAAPTTATLVRIGKATGTRPEIRLVIS